MFIKDENKPKVKISRVEHASGFPEHMSIVKVFYKDGDSENSYGYMDEHELPTQFIVGECAASPQVSKRSLQPCRHPSGVCLGKDFYWHMSYRNFVTKDGFVTTKEMKILGRYQKSCQNRTSLVYCLRIGS